MLELTVFDGEEPVKLRLEHSLLSVSKWESKYLSAFLTEKPKTPEEMLSYYQDMMVDDLPRELIYRLSPEQILKVEHYVASSRSASHIATNEQPPGPKDTTTSELIYFMMVELRIPFEAQTWHLSRLMSLIQIINAKKTPPDKHKGGSMGASWRKLSEARRAQYGSSG